VWGQLQGYLEEGAGILFSSAELDEILEVSDRVVVCFDGRVVLDLATAPADAGSLGGPLPAGRGVGEGPGLGPGPGCPPR
jgi:ABC-type uncharacterized transport system ATPase subunit